MQAAFRPLLGLFDSTDPATRDYAARQVACLLAWHNLERDHADNEIRKHYSTDVLRDILDIPLAPLEQRELIAYLISTAASWHYDPAPLAPLSYALPELALTPLLTFLREHANKLDAKTAVQAMICLVDLLEFQDHGPRPDLAVICTEHDPTDLVTTFYQRAQSARYPILMRASRLTLALLQPFLGRPATRDVPAGAASGARPSKLHADMVRLAAYEAMPHYPTGDARRFAFLDLVEQEFALEQPHPRFAMLLAYPRHQLVWVELRGMGEKVCISRQHTQAGSLQQDLLLHRPMAYFKELLTRLVNVDFSAGDMTTETSAATLHVWQKIPAQPVKYLKAAPSLLAANYPALYPLLASLCSKPPETMTLIDRSAVFAATGAKGKKVASGAKPSADDLGSNGDIGGDTSGDTGSGMSGDSDAEEKD